MLHQYVIYTITNTKNYVRNRVLLPKTIRKKKIINPWNTLKTLYYAHQLLHVLNYTTTTNNKTDTNIKFVVKTSVSEVYLNF